MEESPFIITTPVARVYEFSFEEATTTFNLKVKESDLDPIKSLPHFVEDMPKISEEFKVRKWDLNSREHLGFGGCFARKEENGTVLLSSKVTKRNSLAVALTLREIFSVLHYVSSKSQKEGEDEQEMFLETSCSSKPESYGAAMKAQLSPKFSMWIYEQTEELRNKVNPLIHKSMNSLFKVLFKLKPEESCPGLEDHGFLLSPPTGIYSCQFAIWGDKYEEFIRFEGKMGYEVGCHNLDYWSQQLVLLAGFAQICEAFRDSQKQK